MFSFKLFDDDVTDNMAKTLYLQPSLNTDYAGLVSVILDGQQAHLHTSLYQAQRCLHIKLVGELASFGHFIVF
jgi:hypothetical protein